MQINKLTMGEIAQLEEHTGFAIDQLSEPGTPKARFLTALAWIVKRREDPKFTINQAEALTLDEVNEITGAGDESGEE